MTVVGEVSDTRGTLRWVVSPVDGNGAGDDSELGRLRRFVIRTLFVTYEHNETYIKCLHPVV